MAQQHHIIPGGIRIKPFERQLLVAEVFQGPVGQFIRAAIMIRCYDTVSRQIFIGFGSFQHHVHRLALPDIGDDHCIRTHARNIHLTAIIQHPAVEGPTKAVPCSPLATELNVFPGLFFGGFKMFPIFRSPFGRGFLDILIHFAAANIADPQPFAHLKDLLVKKSAVHSDDDGNLNAVMLPNGKNHMKNHLLDGITVIRMFAPSPENRIHDETAPVHLQGLEPFLPFISRLHSMAGFGVIIVHDHGVNPQFDDARPSDLEPPEKQLFQKPTKHENPCPGKRLEKTLDLVGRRHFLDVGFNGGRIAVIFGQLVEISQSPARSVCHEAKSLLEDFHDIKAFSAFPDAPEPSVYPGKNTCFMQIGDKKRQSASAGESIRCDFNTTNFKLVSAICFGMILQKALHISGVVSVILVASIINNYNKNLPKSEGLFFI